MMYIARTSLQRRTTTRLKWEQQTDRPRDQKYRTSDKDGHRRREVGIQSNDWCLELH